MVTPWKSFLVIIKGNTSSFLTVLLLNLSLISFDWNWMLLLRPYQDEKTGGSSDPALKFDSCQFSAQILPARRRKNDLFCCVGTE